MSEHLHDRFVPGCFRCDLCRDEVTSPARGGPDTAGVDPAEIVRQRTLGWPDFHPEDYCHRCGRPNPCWFADTAEWQTATGSTGDGGGILCPSCFCALWEQQTGKAAIIWRLSIDPRSRDARGRDTAGMRSELAEALVDTRQSWDPEEIRDILGDLLPVVQRLAVEKAAEELRAAAICPTPCDEDCDADCHEAHTPSWKRLHQPEHCPSRLLAAAAQPGDGRTGA